MHACMHIFMRLCVRPSIRKATAQAKRTYLLQFLTAAPCSCPFPHMKEQQSHGVYTRLCVYSV